MKRSDLSVIANCYFSRLLSPYTDKIYDKYTSKPIVSKSEIYDMKRTIYVLNTYYHLRDCDILELVYETRAELMESPHIRDILNETEGYLTKLGKNINEIREILEFRELFQLLLEYPQKNLAFSQAMTHYVKNGTLSDFPPHIDQCILKYMKNMGESNF